MKKQNDLNSKGFSSVVGQHLFQCGSENPEAALYLNADANPDPRQTLPSQKVEFLNENIHYVDTVIGHKKLAR
jgi:hypothetical protein